MAHGLISTFRRILILHNETRSTQTGGMVECMKDMVPVGVLRQVTGKPSPKYRILGLAVVVGWDDGYFHLEGFSSEDQAYERRAQAEINTLVARHEDFDLAEGNYCAESCTDGRDRVVASIVRRRGQKGFRRALINAYGGRCAISGCDADAALEACHIRPYRGPQTNSLSNGVLLRADLHTLFDLALLAVDTSSMTAIVAPELEGTTYSEFAGQTFSVPEGMLISPITEALDVHRKWTGLSIKGNL